jgi:hypothetical protein
MGTPPVIIACIMQAEALPQSQPPAVCCPITSREESCPTNHMKYYYNIIGRLLDD